MYDKNFIISRENMVNNQVITNKVTNPVLIDALLTIEKEKFIPPNKFALTYSDSDIEFSEDRYLMKTFIFAKMLEFSNVKKNDSILIIGCLTGYSVALLSKLSGYVFGLENNHEFVRDANKNLSAIACHNCSVSYGNLQDGIKKNAPYDKIFVEGSVEMIPDKLIEQLKEEGELFTIFKKKELMLGEYMVGLKINGMISYRHLFNANAKILKDFIITEQDYEFKS